MINLIVAIYFVDVNGSEMDDMKKKSESQKEAEDARNSKDKEHLMQQQIMTQQPKQQDKSRPVSSTPISGTPWYESSYE